MTLRRRLVLALGAVLVVLALAFVGVGLALHAYLVRQVDDRLLALAAGGKQVVAVAQRSAGGTASAAGEALVSEVFVGVVNERGRVLTVQAPASEPGLVPRLIGTEPADRPVTRPTSTAGADSVRLVVSSLADGRRVVVAVPLTAVDAATSRLALALGLAWVVVAGGATVVGLWADRLGLEPIAVVTQVARSVTRGLRAGRLPDERVPGGRPGTEAAELAEAFNLMLDADAAAQQRLRRFVADASHELRTPLTTLRGYSSLYQTGALSTPEQVADAMRRINAEASRMATLLDGMLELSTLDAGAPLILERVDLSGLLEDAAADLRASAPDRTIEVDAAPEASVVADPARLQQAVLALGTNAVRHGRGPIVLGARTRAGGVRIEVSDSGPGVPDAERAAIFERFHRAAAPGTPGSGLGLALVAGIASAHGGSCGVEPSPAGGSTFWIDLPDDGRVLPPDVRPVGEPSPPTGCSPSPGVMVVER